VGLWDNIKDGFRSGQAGRGPNYVRKQREAQARLEGLMAQAALKAWRDYQSRREADSRWATDEITGRERKVGRNEWYDGDMKVSVIDGYSRDYDRYVTDILIFPRDVQGRQHVLVDGDGNVLLNEWHEK
jgi:hypothetical protein